VIRPRAALPVGAALLALACEAPSTSTFVVVDNGYPSSSGLVIYQAYWQAASFQTPIFPGASSDSQATVATSGSVAYVVLARAWDPSSPAPPSALVLLQSRRPYAVHLHNTLYILVDDESFTGNCAAGSVLTPSQADFITQVVFPGIFAGSKYDATTCTTTLVGDASGD
jgi:hypothetical protein